MTVLFVKFGERPKTVKINSNASITIVVVKAKTINIVKNLTRFLWWFVECNTLNIVISAVPDTTITSAVTDLESNKQIDNKVKITTPNLYLYKPSPIRVNNPYA